MSERMIPADKVEKITDWLWEDMLANGGHDEEIAPQLAARAEMASEVRRLLLALLPTPPQSLKTLADMTKEERTACRWMQCDVEGRRGQWTLVAPYDDDDEAGLISANGEIDWIYLKIVTPRPDLPRMTWPVDRGATSATTLPEGWRLADHRKYGRVIVTKPTPDCDGRVYFVNPNRAASMGYYWHACVPADLTYIGTDREDDQ